MIAFVARDYVRAGARYRLLHGQLGCRVRCLACGCTQEYGCASGCGWAPGGEVCTRCVGRPRRFEYVERPDVVAIRIRPAA
jgi:hypothetical protein